MLNSPSSHQQIKQQRYNINLPVIRKIANLGTKSKRKRLLQSKNKINDNIHVGSYKSEENININKSKIKYQVLNEQQATNGISEDRKKFRYQQKVYDNDSNKGFRQQFLAEVRKLSDMVFIYDIKNKNINNSNNKRKKLYIHQQSSTQFYPKNKKRYKTLDDYCHNLPVDYTPDSQQQENTHMNRQKIVQKKSHKQLKRYVKLSKLRNIKIQQYKDQKTKNNQNTNTNSNSNQQIQLNSISITKSKSQNRSQIPTPSKIIIQNLKYYIQQKNQKLLPPPPLQLGIQNLYHRRNKLFFSKRFAQYHNYHPAMQRRNNKKKIQLAYVENMLKCNSITKEKNKDFYSIDLNLNRYQSCQNNQIRRNITINQSQHSNLIRKINAKRLQLIESMGNNNGQVYTTSRARNYQNDSSIKINQTRPRNNTFDGSQQNKQINRQLLKYITVQKQQKSLIRQKSSLRYKTKNRQEQKVKRNGDRQKLYKQIKQKVQNSILTESINQWPFKNTSSQHFNQYFYSQRLQKN